MVSEKTIYQDLKNTNKIEDYKNIIERVEIFNNLYDASNNSDCITILTEWDEFKYIDWSKIQKLMRSVNFSRWKKYYRSG